MCSHFLFVIKSTLLLLYQRLHPKIFKVNELLVEWMLCGKSNQKSSHIFIFTTSLLCCKSRLVSFRLYLCVRHEDSDYINQIKKEKNLRSDRIRRLKEALFLLFNEIIKWSFKLNFVVESLIIIVIAEMLDLFRSIGELFSTQFRKMPADWFNLLQFWLIYLIKIVKLSFSFNF